MGRNRHYHYREHTECATPLQRKHFTAKMSFEVVAEAGDRGSTGKTSGNSVSRYWRPDRSSYEEGRKPGRTAINLGAIYIIGENLRQEGSDLC